jgi:hypothetical protein
MAVPRSALPPNNDPGWNPADDRQSYAFRIHGKAFDILANAPLFAGFVCKRLDKALPIEANVPTQIPFLGVYLVDESMGPDGDINAGNIRFTHTIRLGVQALLKNSDQVLLETDLDRIYWYVAHSLLDNDGFTNMLLADMAGIDNSSIEGFTRVAVRRRFGSSGSANETPLGELQFELTCQIRSMWQPWSFPDLERVTLTTVYPSAEKAPDTQQVTVVVDFPVDATKTAKETDDGGR